MFTLRKQYYKLLGISEDSDIESIKKAYRRKAKELHPDRNKAVDAQENFIALNEAYEYLIALKNGNISKSVNDNSNYHQSQKEASRERAKAYAQMRYAEYLRSDYYKSTQAVNILLDYFILFVGLSGLLALLFFAPIYFGIQGFIIALFILLVISPFIIRLFQALKTMSIGEFTGSISYLTNNRSFWIFLLNVCNLYLFLRVTLQTLIPLFSIMIVYLSIVFILYAIGVYLKKELKTKLLSAICGVFLINSLLLINYVFSNAEYTEAYYYTNRDENNNASTYIQLADNAYSEYPGIRIFIDYQKMYGKNKIVYSFSKGFLGYRVMKGYRFEFVQKKSD